MFAMAHPVDLQRLLVDLRGRTDNVVPRVALLEDGVGPQCLLQASHRLQIKYRRGVGFVEGVLEGPAAGGGGSAGWAALSLRFVR